MLVSAFGRQRELAAFVRTAATRGDATKYEPPGTFQLKVTDCPAETAAGFAVKLSSTALHKYSATHCQQKESD
jgi:type 1 fimbria pilin